MTSSCGRRKVATMTNSQWAKLKRQREIVRRKQFLMPRNKEDNRQ